ncbi:MAG: hypothetical protein Q9164_002283 [Protoblastenia rupestris]
MSMNQLQSLQSYVTEYHGWFTAWYGQQPAGSLSAAQLKQQYEAFDGRMKAWLSQAMSNTHASADSGLPSSISSSSVSPSTVPTPDSGNAGIGDTTRAPSASVSSSKSSSLTSDPPQASQSFTSGGSEGAFNPQASNNVAVYWGQTDAASQVDLAQTCQDPNVNIILLAFLVKFNGPGGYPEVNFGPGCGGQSTEQQQKGAAGLLSCSEMAQAIQNCQKMGKKIILSMGGSTAGKDLDFKGDEDAAKAAKMISNLFAGGTGVEPGLRPFSNVKLDGFDLDNESHSHTQITTFIKTLRQELNADSSKKYYISAAPQCPRPDESIPLAAMQLMDFVWVQFYNNAPANCNVDQPGFGPSFEAWAQDLSANGAGPKMYIGAPACGGGLCAGNGYVQPDKLASIVKGVKDKKGFGGIMLWDGSRAKLNVDAGEDYLKVVKGALG